MATYERRCDFTGTRYHYYAYIKTVNGMIMVELTLEEFESYTTPKWFRFLPIMRNRMLRHLCC